MSLETALSEALRAPGIPDANRAQILWDLIDTGMIHALREVAVPADGIATDASSQTRLAWRELLATLQPTTTTPRAYAQALQSYLATSEEPELEPQWMVNRWRLVVASALHRKMPAADVLAALSDTVGDEIVAAEIALLWDERGVDSAVFGGLPERASTMLAIRVRSTLLGIVWLLGSPNCWRHRRTSAFCRQIQTREQALEYLKEHGERGLQILDDRGGIEPSERLLLHRVLQLVAALTAGWTNRSTALEPTSDLYLQLEQASASWVDTVADPMLSLHRIPSRGPR